MRPFASISLALLCITLECQTGGATVRRVPTQYATIQIAINASSHGDTVLVDEGIYYENIRYYGKHIVVGSRYVLDSDTAHISRTVINGGASLLADSGSAVCFVNGEDTTSVLCGFTITGGKGTLYSPGFYYPYDKSGGGVYVRGSGARISHNIITQNTVSAPGTVSLYGAGIASWGDSTKLVIIEYNNIHHNSITVTVSQAGGAGIGASGLVRIVHNTITDNTLLNTGPSWNTNGGGLVFAFGDIYASDNLIARNKASSPSSTSYSLGGGVHTFCTSIQFLHNTVIDNIVQSASNVTAYGGGMSVVVSSEVPGWPQGDIVIESNFFSGNRAEGGYFCTGGAISVLNEKPLIQNNIIVKNIASSGGGIGFLKNEPYPAVPTMINNTITGNKATNNIGNGIASQGAWTLPLMNSIVWGDSGSQELALLYGSSMTICYSDVDSNWPGGTGNINVDPTFVSGDSSYTLQPASPCIGRGIDSLQISGIWYRAPSWDFDGLPRPRPLGPQNLDMGAQEEQITTDVAEPGSVPLSHVLYQNYPNPFNPTTVVRYQLPVVSDVRLVVYDLVGREVAVLVNERKNAGVHEVMFDGSNLASGVYFYRLKSGDFIRTERMLILK